VGIEELGYAIETLITDSRDGLSPEAVTEAATLSAIATEPGQ
jgi:hypothetical protein